MGQEVFNEVALKGYDPRDFVLFACGGAGPTHACDFAPYLGVRRVIAYDRRGCTRSERPQPYELTTVADRARCFHGPVAVSAATPRSIGR